MGHDGLFGIVGEQRKKDPFIGHLFVFFRRAPDRVKILFWRNLEGDQHSRDGTKSVQCFVPCAFGERHTILLRPATHAAVSYS